MRIDRIATGAVAGAALAAGALLVVVSSPAEAIDSNPCVAVFDDLDSTTLHTCTIPLEAGLDQVTLEATSFRPGGGFTLEIHTVDTLLYRYRCVAGQQTLSCSVTHDDSAPEAPQVVRLTDGDAAAVGLGVTRWVGLVALPDGGHVEVHPDEGLGAIVVNAVRPETTLGPLVELLPL